MKRKIITALIISILLCFQIVTYAADKIPLDLQQITVNFSYNSFDKTDIVNTNEYSEFTLNDFYITSGKKINVRVREYPGTYIMLYRTIPINLFDNIYNLYSKMPIKLKNLSKGIRIISVDTDTYGYYLYGDFFVLEINNDILNDLFSDNKYLDTQKKLIYQEIYKTMLHESGHIWDKSLNFISSCDEWNLAISDDKPISFNYYDSLYEQDKANRIKALHPNGLVSIYAESKSDELMRLREDFADSIKMYFTDKDFNVMFPHRAEIISRLLLVQ